MYEYKATVVSVYDGDTITVDVDLGFHITQRMVVRLAEVNAPELKGEDREKGLVSRDKLRQLLPVGARVTLQTYKDGKEKYGRYLACVVNDAGQNVGGIMVDGGFAVFKDYL
jgi:micrococcal nuclease